MVSRINETLRIGLIAYPLSIQVGTGTSGTAVTFDFPFSETPTVIVTGTADTTELVNVTAKTATGFTPTGSAAGATAFSYQAIGLRE